MKNFAPLITGLQTRYSLWQNPFSSEDKLDKGHTEALIPIKRSGILIHIFAVICAFIRTPASFFPLAVPVTWFTDEDV